MILNLIDLSLVGVCVLIITLLYILYRSDKQVSFFKSLFGKPLEYLPNVQNEKEFNRVLQLLPKLSINEREQVIQQCFGRAVRITKGIDKDGHSWLELVTFYDPVSDQDLNFHNLEMLKKHKDKIFG